MIVYIMVCTTFIMVSCKQSAEDIENKHEIDSLTAITTRQLDSLNIKYNN